MNPGVFLRAHWPIPAALVAGVLIGWLLFHSRQPAVHEKADEHIAAAAAKKLDKDSASETVKDAAPTRKVVLEFDPKCPPAAPLRAGDPLPPSIVRQTIYEAGPVQTVTRAATELRVEAAQQTTIDRHLDLTISPQSATWRVGVGFEDVLHARELRVSAGRQIFGPVWVEASAVPLQKSLGVAVAVQW